MALAYMDEAGKVWCTVHAVPPGSVPLVEANLHGPQTCHECGGVITEGEGEEVYPR